MIHTRKIPMERSTSEFNFVESRVYNLHFYKSYILLQMFYQGFSENSYHSFRLEQWYFRYI